MTVGAVWNPSSTMSRTGTRHRHVRPRMRVGGTARSAIPSSKPARMKASTGRVQHCATSIRRRRYVSTAVSVPLSTVQSSPASKYNPSSASVDRRRGPTQRRCCVPQRTCSATLVVARESRGHGRHCRYVPRRSYQTTGEPPTGVLSEHARCTLCDQPQRPRGPTSPPCLQRQQQRHRR